MFIELRSPCNTSNLLLVGFGLGLVAYYVPDLLRFEENDGVYFRIKTVTRDDSIIDLRNPDNHEKCSNFAAINDTASVSCDPKIKLKEISYFSV